MVQIKCQRGFTAVEMMIAVAISSFIAYAIYLAMHVGNIQMESSRVRMELQDSAREGLYKMIQEIRQSAPNRITAPGGNWIQFAVPDPATLVTSAYAVNWAGSHTIRYALGGINNSQIIRTDITTGRASVIAGDVTNVIFAGNGGNPTVVTVTMSVQRRLLNRRLVPSVPLQVTAQAEVRNPVT